MTTWPSGNRDTTEFPSVNIESSTKLREHLKAFTKLDGIGWNDYDEQKITGGLTVSEQRLRTYRKMYEQLGLIYPKDSKIHLSRLGNQIGSLEVSLNEKRIELLEQAAKTAVDILSRYQFKNPVDDAKGILPANFDILPYLAIWQAINSLDGKLHHEELNRVLLRVEHMADMPAAIQKIANARKLLENYPAQTEQSLLQHLGDRVENDQPQARMASWFSMAGWGGLVIGMNDSDGFRQLTNLGAKYIAPVLASPPIFLLLKTRMSGLNIT